MYELQLREAKATLSAVVDDAKQGRPSVITRHGKREAVVVSFEEWERLSAVPSFGWLLAHSPADPADVAERVAGDWRDVEF